MSSLEKGDRFIDKQQYLVGYVANIQRRKSTGELLKIKSTMGTVHDAAFCEPWTGDWPEDDESMSLKDELALIGLCEVVAETNDYEGLSLIKKVGEKQLKQVWLSVPLEVRKKLHEMGQQLKQAS